MQTPAHAQAESLRKQSLPATPQPARADQRADMSGLQALSATMQTSQLQQNLQARQAMMDAGVAQRVVRYERQGRDRVQTAYLQLREHAALMEVKPLSLDQVRTGLEQIESSVIDYGVYDLADQDHLTQMYFDISKRLTGEKKARRKTKKVSELEQDARKDQANKHTPTETLAAENSELEGKVLYDTAYLGAGASVAYAIVSQGAAFDRADDIVIGKTQPWAGKRGPGVVAHPEHMISPIRHFLGLEATDDEWLNRANFSDLIRQVLDRVKMGVVDANVESVEKTDYGYLITAGGVEYHARKVISGIGVGDHTPPQGVAAGRIAASDSEVGAKRIMSMDVFTQVAHRLKPGAEGIELDEDASTPEQRGDITVVLSGANGGIDVAFDALNRGYKVQWIVGNGGAKFLKGFPNYAAYLPYLRALHSNNQLGKIDLQPEQFEAEEARVQQELPSLYEGQTDPMFENVAARFEDKGFAGVYFGRMESVEEVDNGIKASVAGTADPVTGDLLVYAQGQGNGNFELFQNHELQPELDVNRRFSESGKTVLGLTSKDGSLKIIGAMAYRMGNTIDVKPADMQLANAQLDDVCSRRWLDRQVKRNLRKAQQSYAKLIPLVEDAQQKAAVLANLRKAKAAKEEITKADSASRSATALREKALQKFNDLVVPIEAQFEQMRRQPGLARRKRSALNSAQNALYNAMLKTGTLAAAMRPVIDSLPADVLLNDQLTPSRSQIEATHNFVPFNTGQTANFVTDDRTVIATHISARYPVLADADPRFVEAIAAAIVGGRKKKNAGVIVSGKYRMTVPDFTAEPPNGKRYQAYWPARLAEVESSLNKQLQK
ncbi:hypothetical protein [Duganella sp.]|uniref:hypothetical protein n=1 Tax=Duganella sp. TaxID=1904440 RepID=UPI0031D57709